MQPYYTRNSPPDHALRKTLLKAYIFQERIMSYNKRFIQQKFSRKIQIFVLNFHQSDLCKATSSVWNFSGRISDPSHECSVSDVLRETSVNSDVLFCFPWQTFHPVGVQLYASCHNGSCSWIFRYSSFLVERLCRNDQVCRQNVLQGL